MQQQEQDKRFKRIRVKSNFHQFQLIPNRAIYQYKLEFQGTTAEQDVFKACKTFNKKLTEILNTFYIINQRIYAPNKIDEVIIGTLDENEPTEAVVVLKYLDKIEGGQQLQVLLSRLVKQLISTQQGMVQIGRDKLFWPKKNHKVEGYDVEIWDGVQIVQKQAGIVIDCAHKVLRLNNMMDELNRNKYIDSYEGSIVMTKYNKKFYRVEKIHTHMTPKDKFTTENGEEITFKEYYQTRYNIKLEDNQPLLETHYTSRNKMVDKIIFLIPQLCQLTGMPDKLKSDFQTMRKLNDKIKPSAQARIEIAENFVRQLNSTTKRGTDQTILDMWGLKIEKHSMDIDAKTVRPGLLKMGDQIEIDLTHPGLNLEKETQNKMLGTPNNKVNWAVVHYSKNEDAVKTLKKFMKECVTEYKFIPLFSIPIIKSFSDEKDQSLIQVCDQVKKEFEKENKKIDIIIFLLPGRKKNARLYKCAKTESLVKLGCPSQVILEETIVKNTRSIINKVIIQICAKLGGVPWAIDKLPKLFENAMICASDCYNRIHAIPQLAFCSTIDKDMTQYYSTITPNATYREQHQEKALIKSLQKYKEVNKQYPNIVVIYRDGVSDGQINVVLGDELPQYQAAIKQCDEKIKIIVVICNKAVAGKFYQTGSRADNPISGTLIDSNEICDGIQPNFYLISQVAKVGTAQPTLYKIIHSDIPDVESDIKVLTYKLCWLYYNFAGPIKIPAPVRYAHCLSEFIGTRYQKGEAIPFIPKEELLKKSVLYFI